MRLLLGFIVVLITFLGCAAAGGAYLFHRGWSAPGPHAEAANVLISRGSGVSTIAAQLEKEGVIQSAMIFKIGAQLSGDQTALKAGEYMFDAHMSGREILQKMIRGDVVQRRITIPEGQTSWQIIQRLNNEADLDGDPVTEIPTEGTLLPETYSYTRGMARDQIIVNMQESMRKAIETLWPERAIGLPFDTQEQAVTLASIVEKETGIASERAKIAGVFVNRLKQKMPLQTDPTVIYAITKGKIEQDGMGPLGRRLLRKDIEETDSPYNTYKYPGLPPGPIANPGRAAIEAVLNPETHDYIYFVADGTGGHLFARTLTEHNRNVADWRKIRRATGQ